MTDALNELAALTLEVGAFLAALGAAVGLGKLAIVAALLLFVTHPCWLPPARAATRTTTDPE